MLNIVFLQNHSQMLILMYKFVNFLNDIFLKLKTLTFVNVKCYIFKYDSRNSFISPSSTLSTFDVSYPLRVSFTSVYGHIT